MRETQKYQEDSSPVLCISVLRISLAQEEIAQANWSWWSKQDPRLVQRSVRLLAGRRFHPWLSFWVHRFRCTNLSLTPRCFARMHSLLKGMTVSWLCLPTSRLDRESVTLYPLIVQHYGRCFCQGVCFWDQKTWFLVSMYWVKAQAAFLDQLGCCSFHQAFPRQMN